MASKQPPSSPARRAPWNPSPASAALLALALALAAATPAVLRADDPAAPPGAAAQPPAPPAAAPPAAPEKSPDQRAADALETQKITLDFADAPLPEVVASLRNYSSVNLILDAGLSRGPQPIDPATLKVTLRLADITLKHALSLALAAHGLAYRIAGGAVLISTPARLQQVPPPDWCAPAPTDPEWRTQLVAKLVKSRVDLDFTEIQATDALDFLHAFAEIDFVREGQEEPPLTFDLQVHDLPIRDVVSLLGWFLDAEPSLASAAVRLKLRPPAPATPTPGGPK